MNETLKVSRNELKYAVSDYEVTLLKYRFKGALKEDPYNKADGYVIRSLYFDTYANTDYYEKLDGIEDRKKIRLRIYSPNDKKAKLEIKRKYNNNQIKSSVTITREDAEELIKMNYSVLDKYESKAAIQIKNIMKTNHLRPVVLIEYKRFAFMHDINNIRITIDSDIKSSETDFNLFSENILFNPIEPIRSTLVEVKYDGYLLEWINQILSLHALDRMSFSKYTSSRFLFENYLA